MRTSWRWVAAAALALGLARSAAGSVSATLTLGATSISFPNASPGTTPSIAATQNPMSVTVKTTGNPTWSLTVLANGDLVSDRSQLYGLQLVLKAPPAEVYIDSPSTMVYVQRRI